LLRSRLVLEWTLVALFGIVVAASAAFFGAAAKLDNLFLDVVAPVRSASVDDRILIVEIDNDSLAALGNWPWRRDVHARFLDRLKASNPSVIAYDVLFMEPSVIPGDDAALGSAIKANAPTFLPVLYQIPGVDGARETLTLPVEPLRAAAAGMGAVNLLFDSDGLVRRAQLQTDAAGKRLPHLMEQVYRTISGRRSPAFERLLAKTGDGSLLMPIQTAGAFRRVSYSAVLGGDVPAAFLQNKVILVGATADGMGDRYPVSALAGSSMAGIEIQANLLNGLLADRFIRPLSPGWIAGLSALPILILMLLFWRFKPTTSLLLAITSIFALLAAAAILLVVTGLWMPPMSAVFGLAIVYPLWGWRRLAALSGFMTRQSAFLQGAADAPIATARASPPLDKIGQQAAELGWVISEMSDRKRFISDIIVGIPDAICVVDDAGLVTLANPAAVALFGTDIVGVPIKAMLAGAGIADADSGTETTLPDGRSFIRRKTLFANRTGSIITLSETTALRELGREREEMLEFLSHDMRAPQSAILMLLGDLGTAGLDKTVQARIADNARRTLQLADNFVQLARLKAMKITLETVDLCAVAAEAADSVWPLAKEKSISLDTSGLDREIFVSGDASSLCRAISNLIENAIKYSPLSSDVRCAVIEEDNLVTLTVSDNGPGLPPERAGAIFTRFGDRGTTASHGSGLGLAFVHRVVAQHGGEVDCDTSPTGGTTFTLRFFALERDLAA
jgi:CHASE2 domain-containing sensor protein/signal transduction histidine kinase